METTGFQRDENPKRIASIVSFMTDNRNVIQNPLLCAAQSEICGKVVFVPAPGQEGKRTQTGQIVIEVDDFATLSLLDLMRKVKQQLESRVPELTGHHVNPALVNALKRQTDLVETLDENGEDEEEQEEEQEVEPDSGEIETDPTREATEVVFSDESHILDFWHELSGRIQVLSEMGAGFTGDNFLGYTRDAMVSFLKPVVVMDGQHRLRGAIYTAKHLAAVEPIKQEIQLAIEKGEPPTEVQARYEQRVSRWLPVSLLLTNDPAEHVFQFIVVNQKATPVGSALLGTIVSTTLSNDEMTRVSQRLAAADIQLEQSRAVAFLNRNPESPFRDRVETGMPGQSSDRLAWSVMASLVKIFQKLKGGRLFGQKIDFADKWKRDWLADSAIVSDFTEKGFSTPLEYWSSNEGPWRAVFMQFFNVIHAQFGKDDPESWAYWGGPKKSNLFNKISLTILAADFFQFLCDRQYELDSITDVKTKALDWLNGVNRDYFNRDWKLANTKKDSLGIRKSWAKLWVDYRKDPRIMPKSSEYRKNL